MNKTQLSKLAIAGLMSSSLMAGTFAENNLSKHFNDCTGKDAAKDGKSKDGCNGKNGCSGDEKMSMGDGKMMMKIMFKETHGCKFKNACKGLGGCKTTKEELQTVAMIYGMDKKDMEKMEANVCAGHNSCKGLGGCAVDEAKLKTLKENLKKNDMKKDGMKKGR